MAEAPHKSKTSSWVTVLIITAGVIVLGFAGPIESWALGIIGAVIVLVGVIIGFATKIMEDVH
jgi:TRAP-type mannitol/chloroaromatic compound transport system permease large subunit